MPHRAGHYAWDDVSSELLFQEDDPLLQVDEPAFGVPGGGAGPHEQGFGGQQIVSMGADLQPEGSPIGMQHGVGQTFADMMGPNVKAYLAYLEERLEEAKANPHFVWDRGGRKHDAAQYWQSLIDNFKPRKSQRVGEHEKKAWSDYNARYTAEVERLEALGYPPE